MYTDISLDCLIEIIPMGLPFTRFVYIPNYNYLQGNLWPVYIVVLGTINKPFARCIYEWQIYSKWIITRITFKLI